MNYVPLIKKHGTMLRYIKNQIKKLCRMAVKQNTYALKNVQKKFLTTELYLMAVKINGFAIASCTDQTEEICIAAV